MVRWLDQLGGEPAPAQLLEERHAQVLGRARSFEPALNHVVNLELLAAEPPAGTPAPARSPDAPPAERPPVREASQVPAGEPEAKTRRTIDIVGDPDKPRRETSIPLRPLARTARPRTPTAPSLRPSRRALRDAQPAGGSASVEIASPPWGSPDVP
jgi:hypothetical protein